MPVVAPAALKPYSWTSSTLPSTKNWGAVGWGGDSKWAVLAINTTTGGGAYTTDNGTTWSSTNLPTSAQWNVIATDPTNAIMVACNATLNATTFLRSTDGGATWSNVTVSSAGTNASYEGIGFGGGTFVAVGGGSGSSTAIYSTDGGLTWTKSTLPATRRWAAATYDGTRWIAVGCTTSGGGNTVSAISTDGGATWSSGGSMSSLVWQSVTSSSAVIVAGASGSTTTNYSTDGGASWSVGSNPAGNQIYGNLYANGTFLMVSQGSSTSAFSYDGVNWSTIAMPSSQAWIRLAFSGGGAMSASWNGNNTIAAFLSFRSPAPATIVTSVNRAATF